MNLSKIKKYLHKLNLYEYNIVELKFNNLLGEVTIQIHATAQKCGNTPMGQQVLPN